MILVRVRYVLMNKVMDIVGCKRLILLKIQFDKLMSYICK